MDNNNFTLFTPSEKMISGQMAATKHKFNHFSILSNSRLWRFKFDHIVKTNPQFLAVSQPDGEEEQDQFDMQVDVEVNRFLYQDKNLITVSTF
jgi:hypothetical protein